MNPWLPVKKQTPHIKNTAQKEIKNTCLSMFVANIRCSQMLDGPRFNKKKTKLKYRQAISGNIWSLYLNDNLSYKCLWQKSVIKMDFLNL